MADFSVRGGAWARSYPERRIIVNGVDMLLGAARSDAEGSPLPPCLSLQYPGAFRFRWGVNAGLRRISVSVKQAGNTSPRPSLVVKANEACGVVADVSGTAAAGTGWVTIGPITVEVFTPGVLTVELRSNSHGELAAPCFFDHITST